jgi:uncharacterized membrane protein
VNLLMIVHVAAGATALAAGAVAAATPKGRPLHARAGTLFAPAMLTMALTAAILVATAPAGERAFPAGSLLVCYMVATGWWAGRNRSGEAGRFEIAACAFAAALAAICGYGAFTFAGPAGPGQPDAASLAAVTGTLAALAAGFDLAFILRGRLTGRQRLGRHVWRMCVAFFFATGAFFLGQQDVMPTGVRGSAWLFLPALAPFALMLFWIAKLNLPRLFRRDRGPRAALGGI